MLLEQWRSIENNQIHEGYYVSSCGRLRYRDNDPYYPEYHSSNGYDYSLLMLRIKYKNDIPRFKLYPIDDLIAIVFIPVPNELKDKPITVNHIDGNKRNVNLVNLEWVEDIEEWRPVTYPGIIKDMYEVSSWGRVRNKKTGIIGNVKSPNSRGYLTKVFNTETSSLAKINIHRLVGWEFVDNRNIENEVNHINGIKTINIPKNLEWVTHKENMLHAYNSNMIYRGHGEELTVSKLTNDVVIEICKQFIRNWGNSRNVYKSMKDSGFDVTLKQIEHIKHKECWSWLSDQYWTIDDLNNLHITKIKMICQSICDNNGDVKQVVESLKDKIPYLSTRFVQIIKYKESYTNISDEYFK